MKRKILEMCAVTFFLFVNCIPIFASTGTQNISVTYNNIKIVVDGNIVSTSNEPFIYNGTTYLPVRVVAETLGEEVNWDGNTNTVYLGEMEQKNSQPVNEKIDEKEIEILAEYTLPDGIGWYTRHFMVIKNNSNSTVDISTSSLAYSQDKTLVGAAEGSVVALGPGCTSILYEAFETESKISYYETKINLDESEYFKSVLQELSYNQNEIDNGAVFQVTNNGEEPAQFVEGYALFFLDDELVGYESTYFVDNDSEIKPGETISKQMTSYEDFDRIEFYLTGRK